jgi:hypothetical protein
MKSGDFAKQAHERARARPSNSADRFRQNDRLRRNEHRRLEERDTANRGSSHGRSGWDFLASIRFKSVSLWQSGWSTFAPPRERHRRLLPPILGSIQARSPSGSAASASRPESILSALESSWHGALSEAALLRILRCSLRSQFFLSDEIIVVDLAQLSGTAWENLSPLARLS